MKTLRTVFCLCLLTAALLAFAGCATASKTYDGDTDSSEAAKPWDDMSPAEKAGTVLWYPFQYALYFGGSALGSH